jgi:endonuclease/exonuclease/phosphatase family metal-dependent hydrolase
MAANIPSLVMTGAAEKASDHAPAWIELEDIAPIRRKKARD